MELVALVLGDAVAAVRLGALADRPTRKPAWVRHDEHLHVDLDER